MDALASELFAAISTAVTDTPRSRQRRAGPSDLGTPCHRRLGYTLAGVDKRAVSATAWKPTIGTAVHELLADLFARACLVDPLAPGTRWHVEERVTVGQVDGVDVTGSCDLFDAVHGVVWDWKVTTRNMVREKYRPHGPGQQYRAQAHLYGRGWVAAGYPVIAVGIVFFTRDGEFTDRHVWHEPYDEQVAVDALERAGRTSVLLAEVGPSVAIPLLPTADAYCQRCPWFLAGSADLAHGCPGHPTSLPTAPATLAAALA